MKISSARARRISREMARADNLATYGRRAGPTKAQFMEAAARFIGGEQLLGRTDMGLATYKRHVEPHSGMPGFRVWFGANCVGTIFDIGSGPGDRWRATAPDGTRFTAASKPKITDALAAHDRARRTKG